MKIKSSYWPISTFVNQAIVGQSLPEVKQRRRHQSPPSSNNNNVISIHDISIISFICDDKWKSVNMISSRLSINVITHQLISPCVCMCLCMYSFLPSYSSVSSKIDCLYNFIQLWLVTKQTKWHYLVGSDDNVDSYNHEGGVKNILYKKEYCNASLEPDESHFECL